jgi:hypothetical protein
MITGQTFGNTLAPCRPVTVILYPMRLSVTKTSDLASPFVALVGVLQVLSHLSRNELVILRVPAGCRSGAP